jgi:DnaJ-class molecular chaperone
MNKRKPNTIVLVTKHLHLSNGGFGGGHATNMEDIFSQFGDVFGDDMFGSFFGGEEEAMVVEQELEDKEEAICVLS